MSPLSRRLSLPGIALTLLVAQAVGAEAPEVVHVANYSPGEVIRYPVPLFRGELPADATALTIVNTSSSRDTRELPALVRRGKFIGLTELVPGENKLLLRTGGAELPFVLTYKPQTNPYVVRVIYWTDNSGATDYQTCVPDDRQDFRGKLDTALKLMQTFTAESLHDQGLGRKTFNLEFTPDGKVEVHVLRGRRTAEEYHTFDGGRLYREACGEISRQLAHPTAHNLIIPAFTRFDPVQGKALAHTALGGGRVALFGGGDLFTWPSSLAEIQPAFMNATPVDPKQILSDSVGRHTFWANASTTLGAALHELGHTFGLPHCSDPHGIMTRGIDRLNRFFTFEDPPHARRKDPYQFPADQVARWAPVSAQALAAHRGFALDKREWRDDDQTEVQLDAPHRRVIVRSSHGVQYVGVFRYDDNGTRSLYPAPLSPPGSPEVVVDLAAVGSQAKSEQVALRIIDGEGLSRTVRLPDLLKGPFVQTWRFCPRGLPWTDTARFVELNDQARAALEDEALATEPVRSPSPLVDFLQLCPAKAKQQVAGYALRVLRCDSPRQVRLLTGSDDALRVWVNGELVQQALKLRGAAADSETATVTLRAGDNRLLVEVSQAGGGWALYLRFEDAEGAPLELTDEGQLRPVEQQTLDSLRALLRGEPSPEKSKD